MGLPAIREGTALSRLNERQRAFIEYLVDQGGQNAALAARRAGYSAESKNGLEVAGHRLKRDPKVLAAIREQAELTIHAGVLLGAAAMVEIARNPLHKDRLKAADRLMERGGMLVVQKSEHVIEDRRETREILEGLKTLASQHGIPLEALLGRGGAKDAIDGEFTEVEDDVDMTGLEDCL